MKNESTSQTPYILYWRRLDVSHLNLDDRIYWVMQWVFNDPRGDLNGGMPGTLTNACRELAWIARTFGEESEPSRRSMDELILEVRRGDARRARETNLHAIGRSIPTKRTRTRYDRTLTSATTERPMSTTGGVDDGNDIQDNCGPSRSSSVAVSEDLRLVKGDVAASSDLFRIDGISLQTMKDGRDFWHQQYARDTTLSEDSEDWEDSNV
ncbi:unnamed protein product [Tilletia controversa]|nr:unnamed protein product [Tilletia controversa]